jgi:hypothetical protein
MHDRYAVYVLRSPGRSRRMCTLRGHAVPPPGYGRSANAGIRAIERVPLLGRWREVPTQGRFCNSMWTSHGVIYERKPS